MEPKFILTLPIVSLFFLCSLAQSPGAISSSTEFVNPICNSPYWRPPFCNAQSRQCDSASQFIYRCANFYVSPRNVQQRCCVELNPINDNCFAQTWRWVIHDFRGSCAAYGYIPSSPNSSTPPQAPLTSPPSSTPRSISSPDQSPVSSPPHKSHRRHHHPAKSSTIPPSQSPSSSPIPPVVSSAPHHSHHHPPKSSSILHSQTPAPHKSHQYHSPKSSPILPSPISSPIQPPSIPESSPTVPMIPISPSPEPEPSPAPTQPREPQVPLMPPTKGRGRPENCLVDNVLYDSCDPQMPQAINGGSSAERNFIPQTISTGMLYDNVGCCISFALFTNDCNGNIKDLSFAKQRIFSNLQSRCN